jgi:hypothetical protein
MAAMQLWENNHTRIDALTWAHKEGRWFIDSGMIAPQTEASLNRSNGAGSFIPPTPGSTVMLVNDGLNSTDPTACTNNGRTVWTYNQGVLIGGLAALAMQMESRSLIDRAVEVAESTMKTLVYPDGTLKESCEEALNCNVDRQSK